MTAASITPFSIMLSGLMLMVLSTNSCAVIVWISRFLDSTVSRAMSRGFSSNCGLENNTCSNSSHRGASQRVNQHWVVINAGCNKMLITLKPLTDCPMLLLQTWLLQKRWMNVLLRWLTVVVSETSNQLMTPGKLSVVVKVVRSIHSD